MESCGEIEVLDNGISQPLCTVCGQLHSTEENHFYTYTEEVDDDLICHICLHVLVQPLDTPCGHTFCTLCLTNFLIHENFCPMDRKHIMLQLCKKSTVLVKNLLDKLLVVCPLTDHCNKVLQRCDLEEHLQNRCKGASHYGLTKERKRRSQDGSPDCSSSLDLTIAAVSPELSAASAAAALVSDETGQDNPVYSSPTGDSHLESGSEEPCRINRNRSRNFERSTVRSLSFKKLNRAFSVLRRTKSGSAVVHSSDRACRGNLQNANLTEDCLVLPNLSHLIPDGEITCIKINRSDPSECLGIRIVGGNETPLTQIIVQYIYQDGVIARDGRLLPGDMILKVNGIDISNVPHAYALSVLRQPCQVLRLTVLREQRYKCNRSNGVTTDLHTPRDDSIHVVLSKSSQDVQLGIKLVRKRDEPGIFIFNLLDGSIAARDGYLQENDRVLAINGHDVRNGTPEIAAQLIQASEEGVYLVVSRQTRHQTPDILQEAGWHSNSSPPSCPKERNQFNKNSNRTVLCVEKVVNINKDHTESLGMTVAGGVSNWEWDLPIFVTSVDPDGVIGRDGRIKTGDILLNVNGIDLTGVSRSEAVSLLKNSSSSCVVLRVLETKEYEPDEDFSNNSLLMDSIQNGFESREWSPVWVMWLKLPRYLYSCREIVLRRNTAGSLGFSIVGGSEDCNRNRPYFIKSILEGTPAYNDGRIRCGDMLLAVNGRCTSVMTYSHLVRMLKELRGRVVLTIASWPGSFL
ncbi:E3 ubiquitin-protein ligase LNX [Gastrophryne carolinensis]